METNYLFTSIGAIDGLGEGEGAVRADTLKGNENTQRGATGLDA